MYSQYRNTLYHKGYLPIPVRGKTPAVRKFDLDGYVPPTGYDGYNIAILCGRTKYPVCAIDIDTTDAKVTQLIIEHTEAKLKSTIQRIGQAPKTLLVYRATKAGITKKQTHKYDKGRVEILGKGQQFITHGLHVGTHKPYIWVGTNIIHVQVSELPVVSEEQLDALIVEYNLLLVKAGCQIEERTEKRKDRGYDATDLLVAKTPLLLSDIELTKSLRKLSPDCGRQRWVQIGMALHHETDGGSKGFNLWDSWSSGSDKYNEKEMWSQWNSFGKNSSEPITMAYVLKLTDENVQEVNIDQSSVYIPTWDNAPSRSDPLLTLQGHRILSRGSLAVISAPAGQGKTQMVSAICASTMSNDFEDTDTLGFDSTAKNILYIDTEQNRWEHNNTWQKCMYRLGVSKGDTTPPSIAFRLISEMSDINDRKTFLFDAIRNNEPPDIILLDGIGDYVSDVNDSVECVALIYKLSALVKQKNIALLTTLHVNPSSNAEKMRGVLGSELWRKAEFSALIKRVDTEIRCLTTEYLLGKNRSGVDVISQYFKWCGKKNMMVSCIVPATITRRSADTAIPLILDRLRGGQDKDIKRKDIGDSVPLSRHAIDSALQQLEKQGRIHTNKKGKAILYTIPEEDISLW